MADSREA